MKSVSIITRCSVLYKLLILICALSGLLLHTGIIGGEFTPSLFRMFTVQSNCLVFIYYLSSLIHTMIHPDSDRFAIIFKFIMTVSILLTGLVAAFMLGDMLKGSHGTMLISLILLHDIVPLLVLLDWLIFDTKGSTTVFMPLYALSFPLLYIIFIFTTAPFLDSGMIDFGGVVVNYRYPYPFLQIDTYGTLPVVLSIIALAVCLVTVGYLGYWLDHLISRRFQLNK